MNKAAIVFYSLIFLGNLLIATEWAKYGIMELGIQRPLNKKALAGLFIGVFSMLFAGIFHDHYGINPYETPYRNYAAFLVVGVPVVWLLFLRYALSANGVFDFNKARIRTNYWALSNYRPGKKNDEKRAKSLREFGFAKDALRRFNRAIKLQERGDMVRRVERSYPITDDSIDYCNRCSVRCPVCPSTINLPNIKGRNFSGACDLCGSFLTARIEGNRVFLAADLPKPIRFPNKGNWLNAAVAYREMAWLYRMMNMFDEALAALRDSGAIVDRLLSEHPEKRRFLVLKSLVIFGEAEINHVLGNTEKARKGYQESLSLDEKLGDEKGIKTNKFLLNEL